MTEQQVPETKAPPSGGPSIYYVANCGMEEGHHEYWGSSQGNANSWAQQHVTDNPEHTVVISVRCRNGIPDTAVP